MSPRSPTIRDVAEGAGVSVTTVSHVFSGMRKVAEETRQRVLTVATEIGYRPDAAARTLASGKSTNIALEIELAGGGILLNPYFSAVMSSLSVAALQNGFTFTILPSNSDERREVRTAIRRYGVAGAIVIDPTSSNSWIPILHDDGVRVVCIGRYPGAIETSWVDNDHQNGLREAVEHLAHQGYERLTLFSVHDRTSLIVDIEEAFAEATRLSGVVGRVVSLNDLTEASARDVTRNVLESANPPDAIIGAIDRVAVGVMQAAAVMGVRVPEELGVIGIGDTVLADRTDPPLTSIRSTPVTLAHEAVNLLKEGWLNPQLPHRHVLLPADLIIRRSTERRVSSEQRPLS